VQATGHLLAADAREIHHNNNNNNDDDNNNNNDNYNEDGSSYGNSNDDNNNVCSSKLQLDVNYKQGVQRTTFATVTMACDGFSCDGCEIKCRVTARISKADCCAASS
jgi:hypothetical protein